MKNGASSCTLKSSQKGGSGIWNSFGPHVASAAASVAVLSTGRIPVKISYMSNLRQVGDGRGDSPVVW
jgi:hypothetical protein